MSDYNDLVHINEDGSLQQTDERKRQKKKYFLIECFVCSLLMIYGILIFVLTLYNPF